MFINNLKNTLRLFDDHPKDMPDWSKLLKNKNENTFETKILKKKIRY